MTRDKLIEAMARHVLEQAGYVSPADDAIISEIREYQAEAARMHLLALCATLPGLSDLIEGKAVMVPEEATGEMERAAIWAMDKAKERDGKLQERRPYTPEEKHRIRYTAMISASPYRRGDAMG